MVSIIYTFPSVLISTTNSIIHPPFVQSKISRDTTLHPLENSDKIYYYNYHRNWWQHSYYRVSHPLQENSISPLSRKNPNDTILYNFNRPSIRFSRLHRSRHEREKRKKRVEKYGGFSNVWGKDGSRAVITIRTADSARFFNGCLAFRTRQRNIVSVTHPPSRTVISRRAKKVDGTPLSTPPSLLYCRVSRGIRRHSSPPFSLFKSKKRS